MVEQNKESSESSYEENEINKLKNSKKSRTYKNLAASAAALLAFATPVNASESHFQHHHIRPWTEEYTLKYKNPLAKIFQVFWIDEQNYRTNSYKNNLNSNPDMSLDQQIKELNKIISDTIKQINNAKNPNERQQYILQLNQLIQARNELQNPQTNFNNNYEYNENYNTIRVSFGSNNDYRSNLPNKNDKMRDLENHHVSYRFHDTQPYKQRFDRLTWLYQVDKNGNKIGNFDRMLNDGETVLLKFVFKHRSETIQVSYKNRILKIRPINKEYSREIYISPRTLRQRRPYKITFGRWANSHWDGYRLALFLDIDA